MFSLKNSVFKNILKIEDVNKKAKQILEKYKVQVQARQSANRKDSADAIMSDSGSKHSHQ